MLGTLINSAVILVASLFGVFLGSKISEELRENIVKVLGLCVAVLGISLAMQMQNFLIVAGSIVLGYVVGEVIGIEIRLEELGKFAERKFKGKFAEGFVTATLIYCIGSMAILGPIQEALTGDRSIILTKSLLDGVSSLILASSLGIGVAFSSLSVLVYQGFFTIFAEFLSPYVSEEIIRELNATGGVIIFAIGLNLAKLAKIRVGNMLPSLLIAPLTAAVT